MTLEDAPKATKQRRISSYRLGSGQTRARIEIQTLEQIATKGTEWRIKEARRESVYR